MKKMLEDISIQIRFQALTVCELLNSLCQNEQFNKLEFLQLTKINLSKSMSFSDAWLKSIDEWQNNTLRQEDLNLLKSIGTSLGNSDIEGQLCTIELHKENLDRLITTSIEEREKKGKLYRSLGILSGTFISIMLI